jgi:hypothetical protein
VPHTGRLAALYERRSGMRPQRSAMFAIVVLSPPVDGRRSGPLDLMLVALCWRAVAVTPHHRACQYGSAALANASDTCLG